MRSSFLSFLDGAIKTLKSLHHHTLLTVIRHQHASTSEDFIKSFDDFVKRARSTFFLGKSNYAKRIFATMLNYSENLAGKRNLLQM